jgi:hypothetical protein
MEKLLTEPCQPYDMGPGRDCPVDLWAIVERLTDTQLRVLAMALSVHKPDAFEEWLLKFSTGRWW